MTRKEHIAVAERYLTIIEEAANNVIADGGQIPDKSLAAMAQLHLAIAASKKGWWRIFNRA